MVAGIIAIESDIGNIAILGRINYLDFFGKKLGVIIINNNTFLFCIINIYIPIILFSYMREKQ